MKVFNILILFWIVSLCAVYGNVPVRTVSINSDEISESQIKIIEKKIPLRPDQQQKLKQSLRIHEDSRARAFAEAEASSIEVDFPTLKGIYEIYKEQESLILDESQQNQLYNFGIYESDLNSADIHVQSSISPSYAYATYKDTIKVPQSIIIPYEELCTGNGSIAIHVDFGDKHYVSIGWNVDLFPGNDFVRIYEGASYGELIKTIEGVSSGIIDTRSMNGRAFIHIWGGVLDGANRKDIQLSFNAKPFSFDDVQILGDVEVERELRVRGNAFFSKYVGIGDLHVTDKLNLSGQFNANKIFTTGDVQVGTTAAPFGQYGQKLYFGDPLENTDPFFIARYNVSTDVSELHINLGDDQMDKLIVGSDLYYESEAFTPALTAVMKGPKVGIATNDPTETLDVNGTTQTQRLRVQSTSGNMLLSVTSSNYASISTDRPYFYFGKPIHVYQGQVSAYGANHLQLQTNGNTQMTILNSNGNVGIGTDVPGEKLTVEGNIQLGSEETSMGREGKRLYFGLPEENNDNLYMARYNLRNNASELRVNIGDGTSDKFMVGYYPGNASSFNSIFTVDMSGKVGIGTYLPNHALDVKGKIRADEVIITTSGADFVFDKDYRLASLQEVEQHIETKKHLPDIPSAEEMQQNGVGVAELQIKLLQKIEELTLYVIRQQKEIDGLKQQLNSK